jgi:ABC-2 type transport system ATP-binding protein
LIRFEGLRKTFRRVPVLDGIDLEIGRGDRVALVGANGAGKTTLIRCLLGEYVRQGAVDVNGRDPRAHRREVLKHVGFVPQLPPPLKMPVGALVQFAARVCDADPSRILEVAGRLGLSASEIRRRPFVKLSGGEKQKLLIGIALGRDTDVLVMDEPAANLDPRARRTFFDLLAERADSATMLISSHRLDEVAGLVNRVVELDRGRIVLSDHVADQVELTGRLRCRITLTRADEAFAKSIREWAFREEEAGRVWSGTVAGPDRLRFLGVLSRYAALLGGIELREVRDE